MSGEKQELEYQGMAPGVYLDMSNADYHGGPGISKSGLQLIDENPEKYHWKYILGNREESKPEFDFGSAYHTATLEPHKFDEEYVVGPDVRKNTNAWKEFVAQNQGRTILKPGDYDAVWRMADKVRSHHRVGPMLAHGAAEVSVFAEDDVTGELVKVRPDWLGHGYIVDLKSAVNASPKKFFRGMSDYGYYLQASMYPHVCNLVMGKEQKVEQFLFVVQEKEPPYSVALYVASEEDRHLGMMAYRRLMADYHTYRTNGIWPGYNGGLIVPTEMPVYARKEIEEKNSNYMIEE